MKRLKYTFLLLFLSCAQLAYTQKLEGTWIAQGIVFKNDKKISEQEKNSLESVHNRLAFTFEANNSFQGLTLNNGKKIVGTWKLKNNILSLKSADKEFNKVFGKVVIEWVGEMLDMQMNLPAQKNIEKYKPFIRLQKGDMQELEYGKKEQNTASENPIEEIKENTEAMKNMPVVTYKTLTLAIAPTKIACERTDKEPCLQIREDANLPWRTLPYRIEGFDHEEGYEYIMYVSERIFEKPPFPHIPQRHFYTLLQIVSKTKK